MTIYIDRAEVLRVAEKKVFDFLIRRINDKVLELASLMSSFVHALIRTTHILRQQKDCVVGRLEIDQSDVQNHFYTDVLADIIGR